MAKIYDSAGAAASHISGIAALASTRGNKHGGGVSQTTISVASQAIHGGMAIVANVNRQISANISETYK